MTEVHRRSLPSARRSDKMFHPEGGGLPPPVSTGLSLGINGIERTNPATSTPNTGHITPMTSMRTPLPTVVTGSGYETASVTAVRVESSSQSTMPTPPLVPVGNEHFMNFSPMGVISENQAVFLSSIAEMPPSAPVTGIGALSSTAPDLPAQTPVTTDARPTDEIAPPEIQSTGLADAEVFTRVVDSSNVVAEQDLGGSSADLNIGYDLGETPIVSESPVDGDGIGSCLARETQQINDEGFDDMVVFQDDTLTTSTIPVENDNQPPSLFEPVQIINTPPLEPMPPTAIAISDMKVSSDSGAAAGGQDIDVELDGNKQLLGDSDKLPSFDGTAERVLVTESGATNGVDEKCKEEGLETTKPQADSPSVGGGEEKCKEEGFDVSKFKVSPSKEGSLENEEKKGDEATPAENSGIPSVEKREEAAELDVQTFVGRKVVKKFGRKTFKGEVVGYDTENKWFKVVYDDGDEEDLELVEVEEILLAAEEAVFDDASSEKRKRSSAKENSRKQARKPKAKSQGHEKPRGRSKKKGLNAQTNKAAQKAKSSTELRQDISKRKSVSPKGTGADKQLQSQVKSGRKRQSKSDVENVSQVQTVAKAKKSGRSFSKKGVGTSTKGPSKREKPSTSTRGLLKRKGETHQSLSDLPANQNRGKRRKVDTLRSPESCVGGLVEKDFDGTLYKGKVTNFDRESGFFKVKYVDGDQEDLEWEELKAVLAE